MHKLKDREFKIEENYIHDKYFGNFKMISPLVPVNDSIKKATVLLNSLPYILYKYDLGNIILVPAKKDLFAGDFREIYNLHFDYQYGIHFNITRKRNSIIEMFNYDFHTKETNLLDDYTNVIASYYNMDDSKNILYKVFSEENTPLELFLIKSGINGIELEKNRKFLEIRKDENGVLKKYMTTNLETMMSDVVNDSMNFENINTDSNASLIKTAEDIMNKKELEGFKIKIKVSY